MVWWGLSLFICSIYLSLVYSWLKIEKSTVCKDIMLVQVNCLRENHLFMKNYIYYGETGTKIIIKTLLYFQELISGPYRNQSGNCYSELIDRFLSNPQEYQNHETQWIYQ